MQKVLGTKWTANVYVSGERLTVQFDGKPIGEELAAMEREANDYAQRGLRRRGGSETRSRTSSRCRLDSTL